MAITWNIQTPKVCHVGNPVLFYFATNNLYATPGTVTNLYIENTGAITADEILVIAAGSNTFVFTFKASPDDSGNELPTSFSTLLQALKKNRLLFQYYEISATTHNSNPAIRLRQREPLAESNITSATTDSQLTLSLVAGNPREIREGFRILVEIWAKNNATDSYSLVAEEALHPTVGGAATFNAADYLNSLMQPKISIASGTNRWQHINAFRTYFVRYAEIFGNPPQAKAFADTENLFALPGAEPHQVWKKAIRDNWPATWNTFRQSFAKVRKFLTNAPVNKPTLWHSPERLYLCVETWPQLRQHIQIFYSDGSSAAITNTWNNGDLCQWELAVDIRALRLQDLFPGKQIAAWEIWMSNQINAPISETRRLTLSSPLAPSYQARNLLFTNQKGGFDAVSFTGIQTSSLQGDKQHHADAQAVENPFSDNLYFSLPVDEMVQEQQMASHWMKEEELSWLQEILQAEQVYELIAGQLYPLRITNSTTVRHQDDIFLYRLEIDYLHDFNVRHFNRDIKIFSTNFSSPNTKWQFRDSQFAVIAPGVWSWNGGIRFEAQAPHQEGYLSYDDFSMMIDTGYYLLEIIVENSSLADFEVQTYCNGVFGETTVIPPSSARRITELNRAEPSIIPDIAIRVKCLSQSTGHRLYFKQLHLTEKRS